DDKCIRLDFPAGKPEKRKKPAKIIESMSISDDDYEDIQYCPNTKFLLVKLKDENLVNRIKPDFNKMISNDIDSEGIKSVIITAESEGKYDFISRCFAPWEGINEDPVTGSAHTVLASFWSGILNKTSFLAYQASKRGGELRVKLTEGNSRVHLTGEAVTVFESEIEV
ncbi:MAG: PhzF family phenazine biosynthesis protein, partial [Spirochaetota bacterium]